MPTRVVPSQEYLNRSLPMVQDGDFDNAIHSLNFDLKNATKLLGQTLWIDSICYYTQIGECHFYMGEFDKALEMYTHAVSLYLNNSDWLKSVDYSGASVKLAPRPATPWGVSTRNSPIGVFDKGAFKIMEGSAQMLPAGQGNVVIRQNQQLTVIHAPEIARSLAVAIMRRAEILGPLSKYDPFNAQLVKVLGGRPCPPNSFASSWVSVLYGLALSAIEDNVEAASELRAGTLMEGRYDHQLTPIALYELGKIALREEKDQAAGAAFFEASISAWLNADILILGDSFRRMADTHRLIDKTKPCELTRVALKAIGDSPRKSTLLLTGLKQEVAEEMLVFGDPKAALDMINGAGKQMDKLAMSKGRYGARNQYLAAWANSMLAYLQGKPQYLGEANKRFDNAMRYMRRGSNRLWQLGNLGQRFQMNQITTQSTLTVRGADEIFKRLLSDPGVREWTLEPMECMAMSMFTPPEAYEYWFLAARERQDKERAFEIAEMARRQRFYSALPQGPRILALRLLFEGDPAGIPPEVMLERQSLSIDFARFAKFSDEVKTIKRQLAAIPSVPKTQTQREEQKKLLQQLDACSAMQEAMLFPISLTRTKSPSVFPPVLTIEQLRDAMPEKTSMLVFFDALGDLYGFLLDKRELQMWSVADNDPRAPTLRKLAADYLESLGNKEGNANRALSSKELDDENWRTAGNALIQRLLGENRQATFTELVVVPTGLLWYTPFESMCIRVGNELRPLIAAASDPITVRYAPTASLGVPTRKGRPVAAETVAVYGKIWSRNKESVNTALDALGRYAKLGLKFALLPADSGDDRYQPLPSSATAYASQVRQLLVLDDIPLPKAGPLDWSPFTQDKMRGTNPVWTWFQLPWGGPGLMVLPAFHTPAETMLKVNPSQTKLTGNGDELFLSAMVFEACGGQTLLMSRWRTGGRASLDLIGEFLKEYLNVPAAEAWRRAVLNVGTAKLVPEEEPRVKLATGAEPPIANHPFFWSAFILLDRGELPDTAGSDGGIPNGGTPDEPGGELEKL